MVDQNGDPRDEDSTCCQVDEPPAQTDDCVSASLRRWSGLPRPWKTYQNTVKAPFDRVMKAKNMKAVCTKTQTYGTPQDVVRSRREGACFFKARPYRTRVPASSDWFEDDQAEVMTIALTTEPMALMPASSAAITNGDCAAVSA